MTHHDESVLEPASAAPALADALPSIATPRMPIGRGGLNAENVLALQRTAGNQGVARMLGHAGPALRRLAPGQLRAKALTEDGHDRPEPPGSAPVEVMIELVAEDAEPADTAPEGATATAEPADAG